jgi:hypothetical protein
MFKTKELNVTAKGQINNFFMKTLLAYFFFGVVAGGVLEASLG